MAVAIAPIPVDYGLPVSERFAEMQRVRVREERESEAENNLLASFAALSMSSAQRWQRAANRLREERLMGLHPPRTTITASALFAAPGEAINDAHMGTHVTVTEHGERAAVIVSKSEYDRLKVDARLLAFEDVREVAPEGWPE